MFLSEDFSRSEYTLLAAFSAAARNPASPRWCRLTDGSDFLPHAPVPGPGRVRLSAQSTSATLLGSHSRSLRCPTKSQRSSDSHEKRCGSTPWSFLGFQFGIL